MGQLVEERVEVRPQRWRDDWPVAVTAAGAATAVWLAATQLASVALVVRSGSGTQQIGLVSVIVTALVVAMAGAGLLRLLERRSRRGVSTWTVVAGAVWLLSLVGPLGANTVAAGLCLLALHAVVGSVVILGLRRRHAGCSRTA